jgi:hypothetical protein
VELRRKENRTSKRDHILGLHTYQRDSEESKTRVGNKKEKVGRGFQEENDDV